MDLADQQGFLVIDEVPAVGLEYQQLHLISLHFQINVVHLWIFVSNFDEDLLKAHMQTLKELVQRDKNRPAVIMWSIGNEPQSQKQVSAKYFE